MEWRSEMGEFNPQEQIIARVCHQANKAHCENHGDKSQVDWEEAPEWQRNSALMGVRFAMNNPEAPASAQHDAWSKAKVADGWTYGPTKDSEAKTHPCLVPFDQLPPEQQAKDRLFRAVVAALQ
jgi:hypothetical protein